MPWLDRRLHPLEERPEKRIAHGHHGLSSTDLWPGWLIIRSGAPEGAPGRRCGAAAVLPPLQQSAARQGRGGKGYLWGNKLIVDLSHGQYGV
mmetsp:Transcript_36251/g.76411  ORF Transcript_36251/g.76411 Transcript_36251/m.76411 type:complete len:92 (-) Transcript_36251:672-947(-)